MKSPILGSSYIARSGQAAANRMVNLYPEIVNEGGKSRACLFRAPGLRLLATVGGGPIRGCWTFGGMGYVVSGSKLYSVSRQWESEELGTVSGGTGLVSMADNGTQLFIACRPRAFVYNAFAGIFAEITDPDFVGAVTVGYLDGYFLFNEPGTQTIWITQLFDGTAVDGLDFASAEGFPDDLVAVFVDHREAWLFGAISTEVWYNSGASDFPIERVQGAMIEVGAASPDCIAKIDNTIMWLGHDGIVYRANGYTPQRKSTHALETWITDNADISEAQAYSYRQDGHQWYVLTFPNTDTTWVYDVATDAWHERASWDDGLFIRHRSNCHMFFNGEHVVGDFENGNLYALDPSVYSDNGAVQKWLRAWRALPPGTDALKYKTHHSLQLDVETGRTTLQTGQGSVPEVMLRFSDDAGNRWSHELWRQMGAIGRTERRVIWRRLGLSSKLRDRIYEVSGTDPIRIVITGAELDMGAADA